MIYHISKIIVILLWETMFIIAWLSDINCIYERLGDVLSANLEKVPEFLVRDAVMAAADTSGLTTAVRELTTTETVNVQQLTGMCSRRSRAGMWASGTVGIKYLFEHVNIYFSKHYFLHDCAFSFSLWPRNTVRF